MGSALRLLVCFVLCFAMAAAGAYVTRPEIVGCHLKRRSTDFRQAKSVLSLMSGRYSNCTVDVVDRLRGRSQSGARPS